MHVVTMSRDRTGVNPRLVYPNQTIGFHLKLFPF